MSDQRRDPAELAAEGRAEVERLLREARTAERDAEVYFGTDYEEAEHLALTRANNLRLQALSIHHRAEGVFDGEQE